MEGTTSESTEASVVVAPITVEQILQAHKEVVDSTWALIDAGSKWIVKAAAVGALLIKKKEELGYGNWLPWLAENVKAFGYDTANDYMKAARYLDKCPNLTDGTPMNSSWIRNLRQATNLLDDKSEKVIEEKPKPPFVIRFNIDPAQLDEYQRKDAFERTKPLLYAFRDSGLLAQL